ncbi:type II secretion system protein N [Vibrio sonorensis]|uniref:type II secretion system protein N n=1 Tax=Vibrio sonorensis TaxID=1004316 RepID=UPI0008DA2D8C|nr:type II secretion system protein N [Vibrio sonorensis]
MKSKVLVGFLLLLTFVISGLAHLPARVVVNNISLPPELEISGISGTIWNGQAASVRWQHYSFGEVNWQWTPKALFAAKFETEVRFGRGSSLGLSGRGNLGVGMSGAYVDGFNASLPLKTIESLLPPSPIPVVVNGNVELSIQEWVYSMPYCSIGEGSLVINTSGIGTPIAQLDTGAIVADFNCADSVISVVGQQASEQVSSGLTLSLDANRQYALTAWFKPESQFPAPLESQLSWLSYAQQNDRYQFNFQGRL